MSKYRPFCIFVFLLIFTILSVSFVSPVQATTVSTSFSSVTITPKTTALGQQVTIVATISPPPPTGYLYHEIQFSVIDVNGNYRVIGVNNTQPGNSTFYFSWTPDIYGTYLCNFTYPGETLDGTTYSRCHAEDSFNVDPSLPTPTPSPSPIPTPDYTSAPNSTSTATIEPLLNVNCQSSTTYSNFKVNIIGTLTAKGSGITDAPIQLTYSIDGGNSWIPLTYLVTDDSGAFQAVWTPLVTGTYFLKAIYDGNSGLLPASTIVHFAVLPFGDNSVFSVASNSTVTALAFDSTNQELHFKVSGETGTVGYVNVYVSKSLMGDASNLQVYFDQELIQPVTQSVGDSWFVSFTYHHSVHNVALALNSGVSSIQAQTQNLLYVIVVFASAFLGIVAVLVLWKSKSKKKRP